MKTFLSLFCLLVLSLRVAAQKEMAAQRIAIKIDLDGQLLETDWQQATEADSFVVNYPNVGALSTHKSQVRVLYDDQFIFIGAQLFDKRPDSVLTFLSQRDDFGNADYFGVTIDPYGAGQNGFGFYVTAAGVEIDAIVNQNDFDYSWNAVWKSVVTKTEYGWSVEMAIPLSQLRFPKVDVQTWKVNFKRHVRRIRETSFWSPVDPQAFGELAQAGKLTNLKALVSPLRLMFSPYTTAYLENYYNDQTQSQDWRLRQRFGLDMKYGLSESFTLDATLVPDFGQTASDRLVLNLSPFEVRYNENRPFFLEGMDLFGIGDIFYSRRIGAETYMGAQVVDSLQNSGNEIVAAPALAQLVNATKITGRTKSGLGLGFLNAIEKRSFVTYKDTNGVVREKLAHPLSNYNVFVLSQNLKNSGNISFINSNVLRKDIDVLSNVSSVQFLKLAKNRKFSFAGNSQLSINQRGNQKNIGHTGYLSFAKVAGTFTGNFDYYQCSETYDPNELGFFAKNNYRGVYSEIKWIGYEPRGNMLRRTFKANANLEYLYAPSKYAYFNFYAGEFITFKNFLTVGIESTVFPVKEIDHFESRTFGIPVNFPSSFQLGGFYSSDYSKKYALDFSMYNRVYAADAMNNFDGQISPRIRLSSRLFIVVTTDISRYSNNRGFVRVNDPNYAGTIFIGSRDRWIVNNAIAADYTLTNRMGFRLGLNHNWQEVNYQQFYALQNDGSTKVSSYTGIDSQGKSLHNTTFDAFTVDLNFRWIIYPGSEIRFVWKYNIYATKSGLDLIYFNTFKDLFQQPQLNSFSIKALFFIDAGKWKKAKKN